MLQKLKAVVLPLSAALSLALSVIAVPAHADTPPDCPPEVNCQVVLAGLANGCNWSPGNRPQDVPIYGITEHTTDGTLDAALAEAQDTSHCVSWNYLIDQTGKVYVSVPTTGFAYDVGNWWVNTHYIQVEHVGYANDCSTLTPAEYAASVKLDRYLISRFHIDASSATIAGHDSYTSVSDSAMAARHWDPGVCWPWAKYLTAIGAPIVPSASPRSPVVTIRTDNSHQPIQDCPGVGFTQCTDAKQSTTNFVALHTAPSADAPLLSDPYIHADSSPGTTAMQDWGDKADTGHPYVVLARQHGWTQIQYGGTTAWFQDNGWVSVPTRNHMVTPKSTTPVAIYGRPLPEYDAPGWAQIPFDHLTEKPLTKYVMQPGQRYAVVNAPLRTDYAEGCNVSDCTGPGDGTVVIGNTKYLEISWGHHYAFVKADDVQVL
jgi:hypothetical protein